MEKVRQVIKPGAGSAGGREGQCGNLDFDEVSIKNKIKLNLKKKKKEKESDRDQERETKINPKSNQANGKPHHSPSAAAPRLRQLCALVAFQFSRRGCKPAGPASERCGQAAGRAARETPHPLKFSKPGNSYFPLPSPVPQ